MPTAAVPDVVLLTGRVMPRGPEAETPLLASALRARGVDAVIEPWGTPAAMAAPLVVIRTTWDYTSDVEAFLAWLRTAAAATRVVNPLPVVEWNAHKRYLLDLAYGGVPVLPTVVVAAGSDPETVQSVLEEHEGEIVIKPAVSVGAHRTLRVVAGSTAAQEQLQELVADGDALVQPFQPTIEAGEVSVMILGDELSHAVRKRPAAGDYRVQEAHGGRYERHDPTAEEVEVAQLALAAVDAEVMYARVDMIAGERGPLVMEVELIEPQLFLELDDAADRLADVIVAAL